MHHVRAVCAGRSSSADNLKDSPGSFGTMEPRKTVQNKIHFRTIAPKVAPKVVSSCTPSFAPTGSDIAPGAKPFVMQPQNYALMKVAGQDGTFSLVALPQVTSSMGGPVIQTTGIPLQENPKLPIPRYQFSREKKLLNNKSIMQNKPKVEMSAVNISQGKETKMKEEPKEETATLNCSFQGTREEAGCESGIFCEAQVVNVHNPAALCGDKIVPSALTTSPIISNDIKMTAGAQVGESLANCEGAKVIDSINPATVLSPVVFGSPVHLLSSAPKGKVPILPYSQIKKSIMSSCKLSTSFSRSSQSSIAKIGMQISSRDIQIAPPSVTVSKVSIPENPDQSNKKSDLTPSKQNLASSTKKGKRRKSLSDISRYQTKMRMVGNRLIFCKERVKPQTAETTEANDKIVYSTKKYRNIMPKPLVDFQELVSLSGSSFVLPAPTGESAFRNRMVTMKTQRCRQASNFLVAQNDCKMPSLPPKLFYKCPICDHSFQFKHHLQDHLNSHSNKRPYHCRQCRKAYVHSGSLSTHMKLHHSDSRLKRLMCCEFCAKVFGHIQVYFGHLKEVHRVVISTELSSKQVKKNLTSSDEMGALVKDKNGSTVEASDRQMDDVLLQIICGRCEFITPTFSDMKVHLFCVHGDEIQETIEDGVLVKREDSEEEAGKNTSDQWKPLSENHTVLKDSKSDDEHSGSSISNAAQDNHNEIVSTLLVKGQGPPRLEKPLPSGFCTELRFCCGNVFNCLLCKHVFEVQSELFEHWEKKHNCEDPLVLWEIFSSFTNNDKELS